MTALLLAALLPGLYSDQPVNTADTLHRAGIERICVPTAHVKVWRKHGFEVTAFDRAQALTAKTPGLETHIEFASATHVPWVSSNGGQFQREPARRYFYDAHAGSAALAAAEAFAYGVEAAIDASPGDLDALAKMLKFLRRIDQPRLPLMANVGVIDEGAPKFGEFLNLMTRYNVLFDLVSEPSGKYPLNIRLGKDAGEPYPFVMGLRRNVTDEKRWVRLFGSNVVIARLTGGGKLARLHLLNYGGDTVHGLHVRVRDAYKRGTLSAFGIDKQELRDYAIEDHATEFTIAEMPVYAVVDLSMEE